MKKLKISIKPTAKVHWREGLGDWGVPELVEILIGNLQESGFLVKLILFLCLKFVPGCYFSVEFL